MANNVVQVKRTSVSGRTPNTTGSYATNTQYISAGELAINMADGILFSSNGSAVIEVGANNRTQNISTNNLTVGTTVYVVSNGNVGLGNSVPVHKLRIDGSLSLSGGVHANGSLGSAGQVLTSNGSVVYWSTSSGSPSESASRVFSTTTVSGTQNTFSTSADFIAGTTDVYFNGVRLSNSEYTEISANSVQLTVDAPNGTVIDLSAWSSLSIGSGGVNAAAQYTWTNTQTFSNTVYLNAVSANGSLGTSGQVLTSNGSDTYWATPTGGGTSITTEIVTGTTQTAVKDYRYVIANTSTTTVTLPASPSLGDTVYILVANDLANNIVARNGLNIMSLAEDLTLDQQYISIGLVYTNSTLGWRII